MALIRPQLLFFGVSPSGLNSFDKEKLTRDEVKRWISEIIAEFDIILLLEFLELGLALISLQVPHILKFKI